MSDKTERESAWLKWSEQVITAATSHQNTVLDTYRRLVISMLTAVTVLETTRVYRGQMTAEQLNELADRKCQALSPLERQVHNSILELEKFRIEVLRAGNHATVKALGRILAHERTRFGRSPEVPAVLLERYGLGHATYIMNHEPTRRPPHSGDDWTSERRVTLPRLRSENEGFFQ